VKNSRSKEKLPKKQLDRDQKIRDEYRRRKSANARYSLRSFAKDCGLSPSFTAYLDRGLRSLSYDQYLNVAKRLGISAGSSGTKNSARVESPSSSTNESGRYRSAEFLEVPMSGKMDELTWTDIKISDLTLLKGFRPDVVWIGKKLGVPATAVSESIEKLLRLGVLRASGESLVKSNKKVYLSATQSLTSLRKYHREAIQSAVDELAYTDDESFQRRLITGATLSVNERLLPELREKLNNFIQEVIDLCDSEEATALYQINLQFFPLSKKIK
jgi:DNA-binding Lrp family transcriptional regulator